MYDFISGLVGMEMEEIVSALEGTPYDIKEGVEEYKVTGNFSFVDIALEKKMFERVVEKLEKRREKELKTFKNYLQVFIDSLDLKTMLRGKADGIDAGTIRKFLIKFEVEREYEESSDMNEFLERLKETRYSYLIDEVREGSDLTEVENKIEDAIFKKGKEISASEAFGLGPIIGFLVMKEAEIRNIRAIYRAKEAGLPPEEIRKLVFVYG